MSKRLRLVMAQINLCVGDIIGNAARVVEAAHRARNELGGDVVIFPELTLTGYPPEDLLLRPDLYLRVEQALEVVKARVASIDLIVGYPRRCESRVYNAASLFRDGEIIASYHKHHLPNYGVFDEKRYFTSGAAPCVVDIRACLSASPSARTSGRKARCAGRLRPVHGSWSTSMPPRSTSVNIWNAKRC
jgi:NAD+ synthase (glutamine-hydrolysing)